MEKLTDKLKAVLSKEHWSVFTQYNNQIQEGLKASTIQTQQMKLTQLKQTPPKTRQNEDLNKQRWVKNLSDKNLSAAQVSVLEKGLNFAITPQHIPRLDIIASVEKGLRSIRNQAEVVLARSKITQIVRNAKLPQPNLSKDEMEALKELRSDTSIKIMKADKGNATVVMDSQEYEYKLLSLLNSRDVYQILPDGDNSIVSIEKQVNKLLWRFAKENKSSGPTYYQLKCDKSVTPKIYRLPKLHKTEIPLRPIVSFIGPPIYCLSKFLVDILSPLLTFELSVKNSFEFAKFVNNFQCNDDECLVSFDVMSLFTSIPTPDVLQLVSDLLLNDNLLSEPLNYLSKTLWRLSNYAFIPSSFLSILFFTAKPLVHLWALAYLQL